MCLERVLIDIISRIGMYSGFADNISKSLGSQESVSHSPNMRGGDTKRCEKKGCGETRESDRRQNVGGDI